MREPWPWQTSALEYGRTHRHAAFLLDKRLGKCYIAFKWAIDHQVQNVLIIAPKSAIGGWLDEATDLEINALYVQNGNDAEVARLWNSLPSSPTFFITNSQQLFQIRRGGTAKSIPTPIATLPYDAVIVDEATCLKNTRSKTCQVINECFGHAPLRAILSGEIAPEGDQDVFEPMKWCLGEFMGKKNFWAWRYEYFRQVGYDWIPKPGQAKSIREAVQNSAFYLSRKDAGVGERKTWEPRYCQLPQNYRNIYRRVVREFAVNNWETKYAVVVHTALARLAGGFPDPDIAQPSHHKLNLLEELLRGEYAHESVVVLFRFNDELTAAEELCERRGISYARIDGSVSTERRHELRNLFAARRVSKLLMQAKVAKFGIDLSAADTMIRYSMPPDYETYSQSMDRIVHVSKKLPLHYIDLITEGTTDEDLVTSLRLKGVTARSFIEDFSARLRASVLAQGQVGLVSRH